MNISIGYVRTNLVDLKVEGCNFMRVPIELVLNKEQHKNFRDSIKIPVASPPNVISITWNYEYKIRKKWHYRLYSLNVEES